MNSVKTDKMDWSDVFFAREGIELNGAMGSFVVCVGSSVSSGPERATTAELRRQPPGSGHRYSRRQQLQLRRAAHDIVRILPLTGMVLTMGFEITTVVAVRLFPRLLPSSFAPVAAKADRCVYADAEKSP